MSSTIETVSPADVADAAVVLAPKPARAKRAAKQAADKPATTEAATAEPKPVKRARLTDAQRAEREQAAAAAKQAATEARDAKRATAEQQRTERAEQITGFRTLASAFYAGASLAAHRAKPSPRQIYAERVQQPAQRCRDGVLTPRDESGLALILSGCDDAGSFDPCALAFDAGILSRLASVDLVTFASDTFTLSPAGRERATALVNRASKAAA